jgi:hypothetical protein
MKFGEVGQKFDRPSRKNQLKLMWLNHRTKKKQKQKQYIN